MQWNAGIHQAEEKQRHVRRVAPPDFELTERVMRGRLRVNQESGIAPAVRQERHDRHEGERRMHSAPEQPPPRHRARPNQVEPECFHAGPPQAVRQQNRDADNDRTGNHVRVANLIEYRQHDETQHIGGDREQQQERDRRRMATEDQPGHEIADGDVGSERDRPADAEHRFLELVYRPHVDQRGNRRRADRRNHRQQDAPP